LAAGKGILASAAPVVKYELARSGLRTAGIPDSIAIPAAMLLSGYQRGGVKSAAAPQAETVVPASSPVDLSAATAEATAARAARFGSQRGWAAQLAQNPDGWRVDASGLTAEQTAAQAAVHNAPVAPEAALPVSGPQGVPASAQVPSSFAALLRPPSPAQLANVEALVARGRPVIEAVRTVSRGDQELGARLMSALQQSHK
jgi:hypothetical protein